MTQTAEAHTVVVNEDVCIGGGQCVFLAPGVFSQRDEDGVVVVLNPHPDDSELDAVREAVEVCPARVISLTSSRPDGE